VRDVKGPQVEGTLDRLFFESQWSVPFLFPNPWLEVIASEHAFGRRTSGGITGTAMVSKSTTAFEFRAMDRNSDILRVELVDSHTLIREALAALMRDSDDLELVATASSSDEAVRCAEELQPDVALMDVLERSVFDTANEILRRSPHTKIVLLDDAPSDSNAREALRINAAGYVTKRQPYAQIESALRQAAQGQRVFAPEIARRLVLSPSGVRLPIEASEQKLATLTHREIDVLVSLAQGNSVKQCAKLLGIGTSTVGNHKSRLMKKLGIHKTVELTRLAIREGLISASGTPTASMEAPSLTKEAPC